MDDPGTLVSSELRIPVEVVLAAGADFVVPGSLAFRSPDPARTFEWLRSLPQ